MLLVSRPHPENVHQEGDRWGQAVGTLQAGGERERTCLCARQEGTPRRPSAMALLSADYSLQPGRGWQGGTGSW